jgi:hypothetical protein
MTSAWNVEWNPCAIFDLQLQFYSACTRTSDLLPALCSDERKTTSEEKKGSGNHSVPIAQTIRVVPAAFSNDTLRPEVITSPMSKCVRVRPKLSAIHWR